MLPNPELGQVTIKDYLQIIKKRIAIIVSCLVIIPTVEAIILFNTPPVYRATASLLVEKTLPKITQFEITENVREIDKNYLETQVQILKSMLLSEQVYNELNLAKDPDFRDLKDPIVALNSKIEVELPKNSSVVLLHVDDSDPLKASSIANGIAKVYIDQDIESRNYSTRQAAGWLEDQLGGLKEKVEEAEKKLNDYIQKHKIVTLP